MLKIYWDLENWVFTHVLNDPLWWVHLELTTWGDGWYPRCSSLMFHKDLSWFSRDIGWSWKLGYSHVPMETFGVSHLEWTTWDVWLYPWSLSLMFHKDPSWFDRDGSISWYWRQTGNETQRNTLITVPWAGHFVSALEVKMRNFAIFVFGTKTIEMSTVF